MRSLIKRFVISTAAIYLIDQAVSGLVFQNGFITLATAGAVLALSSLLVKPILNILLLPLNLVTFGLFRWVTYAITLYLVTRVVTDFQITTFSFAGLSNYWFSLPAFSLGGLPGLLAFSLSISFIYTTIAWIMK